MKIERLTKQEVLAIHSMQLSWHGGAPGIKNEVLLDAALAHVPKIGTGAGGLTRLLATLAAADAIGIARNRPFADGNRRTALVAACVFIERNGFSVKASQEDAYSALYNLSIGIPSEEQFASWLEFKIVPVPK